LRVRFPRNLQEWAAAAGIVGVSLALIAFLSGAMSKVGDALSGEPSTEDFIAEVDRTCREIAARTGGGRLSGTTVGEQLASMEAAHQAIQELVGELERIDAPEELEVKYRQFIEAERDFDVIVVSLGEYLASGEIERGQAMIPQLQASSARRASIAEDIGFAECGGT
jgi:hypothetical protein